MRVVAGLGNPGAEYARTRHNAGFRVVELLAERAAVSGRVDPALDAWVAEASLEGESTLLVRPLAFMNRSGLPLARVLAAVGASPADLLLVVDDVALCLGRVRVRERGRDGGHNGLRSVIEELRTDELARVRIGVRHGELPPDLAAYVLAEPAPEERPAWEAGLGLAADAVVCVVCEGATRAMDLFNGRRDMISASDPEEPGRKP